MRAARASSKGSTRRARDVSLSFDATGRFLALRRVGRRPLRRRVRLGKVANGCSPTAAGDARTASSTCEYNPHDGQVRHRRREARQVLGHGGRVPRRADRGVYGRVGKAAATVLSIAFHPDGSTLTGTQRRQRSTSGRSAASSALQTLRRRDTKARYTTCSCTSEYIVTGGKDGKVHFLTQYVERVVHRCDMAKGRGDDHRRCRGSRCAATTARPPCVKSICSWKGTAAARRHARAPRFSSSTCPRRTSWQREPPDRHAGPRLCGAIDETKTRDADVRAAGVSRRTRLCRSSSPPATIRRCGSSTCTNAGRSR